MTFKVMYLNLYACLQHSFTLMLTYIALDVLRWKKKQQFFEVEFGQN